MKPSLTKTYATGIIMMTCLLSCPDNAAAQEKAWKTIDATELRLINKGWENTLTPYTRCPQSLQSGSNTTFWGMSLRSAGIGVRFATNSTRVGVKYELTYNSHMNHMADTGTKGMDLYILEGDSAWRHVNTLRPANAKAQEGTFVSNLDGGMHEYMIYLPLYDGVNSMSVKVDENAKITKGNPEVIDKTTKKVVAYGTSILQGGCASRTGMCPTNILSRELNCEVVNLAVSGGGKMDMYVAEAMAAMEDVGVYIVDPVPNCDEEMCRTLTYDFVNTLRKAKPDVPIVMVEGPLYPYSRYDSYYKKYLADKNKAFYENYERLYAENPKNIYYVTAENLDGYMDDGTVDGVHLTDHGFWHYCNKLLPVLRPLITGRRLTITSLQDGDKDVSLTPTISWSIPEREVDLQIATSATFSPASIVYTAHGSRGSMDVEKYKLGTCMNYYARLIYTVEGQEGTSQTVGFSTIEMTPAAPVIAYPQNGGTLYANQKVQISPIEGVNSIRLEIAATDKFPPRTSYINTAIHTDTWADSKTGAEIKLGTTPLADGQTYYARVRASYNTPEGNVNTEFSEPITFVYSSESGIDTPAAYKAGQMLRVEGNGTESPRLTISGEGERASLRIHTLSGTEISTVYDGPVAGEMSFDTKLRSGVYLATLHTSAAYSETVKLIIK